MERTHNGQRQKYCLKCETWKPIDEFPLFDFPNKPRPYYCSPCKPCRAAKKRARWAENPALYQALEREYKKSHAVRLYALQRYRRANNKVKAICKEKAVSPPKVYGDCKNHPEPCPWIRCRYHMIWDRWQQIKLKGNAEIAQILSSMPVTCCLDYAKRDHSLEEVGKVLGITKERVRQIQDKALRKINRVKRKRDELIDFIDFENDRKTDNSIYFSYKTP